MMIPTALRRYIGNPHWILWGYLLLIAAAELLTSYSAQAGLLLHAFILIGLLLHSALERTEQVRRLTLALVLAPLIRLLSLSLPLGDFPEATWHPIISIPLLIATWMIARQLHVSRRDIGLRIGNPLIQCMLIGGGITLGALEYAILSPEALLPTPTWGTASLTILSLFVFTGFTEEIIFRGLLQSLAMPVLRRWGLIYVSLLFGALHITYNSLTDFIFVTIVGLIFAYIVLWSDSILGVTLAHGLTNATLFVLLPYLSQNATGPVSTLIYWSIWIGTGLWLIAFGALMWRADAEGRLLLRDQPEMADDGAPATPSFTQSQAWQRAQSRISGLGLAPRIQSTRVWKQLEQRGAVARIRQLPWSTMTPRVTSAFILGGVFGILGSAGLLLAFGGQPNQVVAPASTSVAIVEGATPTTAANAAAETPTAPAVAAVVPTPTLPSVNPTIAPTPSAPPATTAEPVETAVATTAESVVTAAPTAVLAVSLPWPEAVPAGMSYVPTDSWPFRFVGLELKNEPFLIFRDESRWLVLRDQPRNGHPVPASATRENVEVDGSTATLLTYADGGRQLIWERDGEALQLSGSGLSADEIVQTANSLVTLDPAAFEARLSSATRDKRVGPSLLWPNTLPAGLVFQPIESFTNLPEESESAASATVDGYALNFRSATSGVTIGGGNVSVPLITGDEEIVQFGKLEGRLITNEESILLVVNTPNTEGTLPHLDVLQDEKPAILPPVQQGPVFVVGDNLSRADFERVVAGLLPLSPSEFVPRSRGQIISDLTYMWPASLPSGYTVDTESVTFGWDDFLLQGGRPYFSVTASNRGGNTITVQGGRESSGAAFVIPEGGDVEQFFPTIRGQTATAARTSEGSIVIWSENDVFYSITSPSLDVDTLASIAENLRRLTADEFYAYLR